MLPRLCLGAPALVLRCGSVLGCQALCRVAIFLLALIFSVVCVAWSVLVCSVCGIALCLLLFCIVHVYACVVSYHVLFLFLHVSNTSAHPCSCVALPLACMHSAMLPSLCLGAYLFLCCWFLFNCLSICLLLPLWQVLAECAQNMSIIITITIIIIPIIISIVVVIIIIITT